MFLCELILWIRTITINFIFLFHERNISNTNAEERRKRSYCRDRNKKTAVFWEVIRHQTLSGGKLKNSCCLKISKNSCYLGKSSSVWLEIENCPCLWRNKQHLVRSTIKDAVVWREIKNSHCLRRKEIALVRWEMKTVVVWREINNCCWLRRNKIKVSVW